MNIGDEGLVEGFLEALLDDDAETLYDRAPCGYLSTTPDGTVLKANATFLSMTGYRRKDLLGRRRFVDLLSPGSRIYHETHYAPMLKMQGLVREIALDLVGADGRRLPVLVNAVQERDHNGHPVVIRAAVFDAALRRSYEEELLREKRRAEASEARARGLALALQRTLLPPRLPGLPGLDLGVEHRAAGDGTELGGDFFDVFQAGREDWVVLVGDVSGKGTQAAETSALARHALRSAAMQDASPARALAALNAELLAHDDDQLCTVVMLRLTRNRGSWHTMVAVAGHPLPLRLNRHGSLTTLGTPGTVLGAVAKPSLAEVAHTIEPGETLLAFTNGLADDRLAAQMTAGGSASDVCAAVIADALEHQSGAPRDDMVVVTLKAV